MQNSATNLVDYTVIGFFESNGQIWCDYVKAASGLHAFAVAAEQNESVTFTVAIRGIHSEDDSLVFPGTATVDAETVLQQPDVFNAD